MTHWVKPREGGTRTSTRKPGDRPYVFETDLSGVTGKGDATMKTLNQTQAHATVDTGLLPILSAIAAGVFLIYFAGFAQAAQYHDSAHDTRHTLAFPCH